MNCVEATSRRTRTPNSQYRLRQVTRDRHRAPFRSRPIPHPGAAQTQGMSQLVEPGRGFSDDPALLRFDIGALSHRFPANVSPKGPEDTALHHSASLTGSVRKNTPGVRTTSADVRLSSQNPLMSYETAHHSHGGRSNSMNPSESKMRTNRSASTGPGAIATSVPGVAKRTESTC